MVEKVLRECIDQAERFLALREHNRKELCDKLRNKGFDKDIIDKTIAFLIDEGELSEERYVRSFVRSGNNRHPEGMRIVLQRLAEKGADREISREIVTKLYTDEYTESLAYNLLAKLERKTDDKQKIRLKMSQAGFSLNLINKLINSN